MTVVREFHEAFDLPAPHHPDLRPEPDMVRLRMRLIREEFNEVMEELGRVARYEALGTDTQMMVYRDLLKELADLRYVVEGTAVSLGLPIEEAYAEVHRSNMSKLGEDGLPVTRDDGKVLKGPNYTPADMYSVLPDIPEVEGVPV